MMNILASIMGGGGGGPAARPGAQKAGKAPAQQGLILYPDDAKKFVKWGMAGFLGFGAYQMAMLLAKRSVNASVDFLDPVEAMNHDPSIRDALIQLQGYRKLNAGLFRSAVQNIDQLLFLEAALIAEEVHPVKKDKVIAWTHFRVGVNRLSQFQYLVREQLGQEHGMTVSILIKRVYTQMQKHLLNILHLCSEFHPDALIARAPLEVERALRRMEDGSVPEDSHAKWERLRGRLDKKLEDRPEHHRHHQSSSREHRRHHHRESTGSRSGGRRPETGRSNKSSSSSSASSHKPHPSTPADPSPPEQTTKPAATPQGPPEQEKI